MSFPIGYTSAVICLLAINLVSVDDRPFIYLLTVSLLEATCILKCECFIKQPLK